MGFVKLRDASKTLGLKYYNLREMAVAGKIPAFRTGGDKGTWLVDVDQVKESVRQMAAQEA